MIFADVASLVDIVVEIVSYSIYLLVRSRSLIH